MAPPIIRDVDLALPRGGVGAPPAPPAPLNVRQALVTCWTGRGAGGGPANCATNAEYGPTPAYGNATVADGLLAFHRIVLGDLTPGQRYHFRIHATGSPGTPSDGETSTSQDYSFTQPPAVVPPGPAVAGVTVDQITATGARVSWTTAVPEPPGRVEYGPTAALGAAAAESGAQLRAAHTVTLAGLTAATVYSYRVAQPGRDGGATQTAIQTFTTAA